MLSHLSVWKRISAETCNEPVLVLEDDALLSNRIPEVLESAKLLSGIDHLNLEVSLRRKLLSVSGIHLVNGISYLRLYQDRNGAGAYVLWPSGARKLVTEASCTVGLVDEIICRTNDVVSYQIEPACAVQLSLCPGYGIDPPIEARSAIAASRPIDSESSYLRAFRFYFRRIKAQMKLGFKTLLHAHHSVRREVRLYPGDFRRSANRMSC